MSDQSKFINTYIDVIIGTVHEKTNNILQLKTQLKVTNDLLSEKDEQIVRIAAEKDEEINKLKTDIEKIQSDAKNNTGTIQSYLREIENLKAQISKSNQEIDVLKNKAGHTESLLQQIVAMKQEIKNRDSIIHEKDAVISEKNKSIIEKENMIRDLNQQKDLESKSKKLKTTSKTMDLTQINKILELQNQKDDF